MTPPSLSSAASSLRSAGISTVEEVFQGLESREVVAVWVYWSKITRTGGWTKINEIIGDGFDCIYFPNKSEFRVTVKK